MPDRPDATGAELGRILIAQAREAIALRLGAQAPAAPDHPALHEAGACFVTLTKQGQLRGCIGHLQAVQALGQDVRENACAAAFHDPRFAAVSAAEWPAIKVEVSVLGPATFTPCPTEEDALRQIVPFEDGVILTSGSRRATFLPQVWEQLPEPQEFLAHLLQKAGLPVALWPSDMQLGLYRVQKFKESA